VCYSACILSAVITFFTAYAVVPLTAHQNPLAQHRLHHDMTLAEMPDIGNADPTVNGEAFEAAEARVLRVLKQLLFGGRLVLD
jgi:hypothetical protein